MTLSAEDVLQTTFGFTHFREGQAEVVRTILEGRSTAAIFPTGSGKSLCYQLPAILLPHLTLVVSPLLALMQDQLSFLKGKGIAAGSIDSTQTREQAQAVMNGVREGRIKILMISVERLNNERFRQFIHQVPISLLVVDEAHCISEWGHNFRPDYLKLPSYCKALNISLVLLLTATATRKVKQDMAAKFAIRDEHIVQTGFYRQNLDLSVLPVAESDKNKQLEQVIKAQQGAGIVYVSLQHTAEKVAQYLTQQGINACAYHAGFANEQRQQIQDDFMSGKVSVIVATIAFGMGIDKSDIRFVIHYDLPKSIENYSQEIGRAGRDGQPANCITLANLDGLNTVENFVYGDTPELSGITTVIDDIKSTTVQGEWELQGLTLSNTSNIRQLPLKTLLVQLELLNVLKPQFSYFADFKYKFLATKESILATFAGERGEFLKAIFTHSKMKKVWAEPDFDSLFNHYQCERSRVVSALEYLKEQQLIELETKRITEVFSVNQESLNEPELAGKLQHYFSDKEEKEIVRIATLIRFFELDKCLSRNLSLYFDDQQVPENCGHCSVCRGKVAKLSYSQNINYPSDEQLTHAVNEFIEHMQNKLKNISDKQISVENLCRFLAGMTVPLFNRNKVKKLSGFGLCENMRYQDIRDKVVLLEKRVTH